MAPLRRLIAPLALAAVALAAAAVLVMIFPPVEGLGDKVKLPIFHGAMTWVNLAVFTVMALAALVHVLTRAPQVYAWEEALRWVAVPMWAIGSLLGFLAATQTWDFTGSRSSKLEIVLADPRLVAQFWILLAGFAVIAAGLLLEERHWLSAIDVGFVAVMWLVLLRAMLGPGRALHPDSPVLNSDEIRIKAIFFGIVAAQALAAGGLVWAVRRWRAATHQSA